MTLDSPSLQPDMKPEHSTGERSPGSLPALGLDHIWIAEGVQSREAGVRYDRRRLFRWEMDAHAVHVLASVLLHRGIDPQLILRADGVFVRLDRQGLLFQPKDGAANLIAFVEPLNLWLQHWAMQVQEQVELSPEEEDAAETRFGVPLGRLHDAVCEIAVSCERRLTLGCPSMKTVELVVPPVSQLRKRRAMRDATEPDDRTIVLRIVEKTHLINDVGLVCSVDSVAVDAKVQEGTKAHLKQTSKHATQEWRSATRVSPLEEK
ncbi:MAG: hypothetical protein JSS45_10700 [Proteobacteria bacterium]|nr:hypothetical protein [Pseudomonadota bacterium]